PFPPLCCPRPRGLHAFPTRRSSDLVSVCGREVVIGSPKQAVKAGIALVTEDRQITGLALRLPIAHNITLANMPAVCRFGLVDGGDRKSTRLNSSHEWISYAVFCLKK